jgi:ketosteroid isomerase-like protein
MRIVLCSILLILFVSANAQTILPVDSQEARLLSLESAWNQAVQAKDVKAINSLMDQDLVSIDYDGSMMNKAQYMASVSAPAVRLEHVVNDSMQVQVYGQSAVVFGVYLEKGVKNRKAFVHRERFVDTWINRNGAWLCVASQSTLILH